MGYSFFDLLFLLINEINVSISSKTNKKEFISTSTLVSSVGNNSCTARGQETNAKAMLKGIR